MKIIKAILEIIIICSIIFMIFTVLRALFGVRYVGTVNESTRLPYYGYLASRLDIEGEITYSGFTRAYSATDLFIKGVTTEESFIKFFNAKVLEVECNLQYKKEEICAEPKQERWHSLWKDALFRMDASEKDFPFPERNDDLICKKGVGRLVIFGGFQKNDREFVLYITDQFSKNR